MSTPKRKLKEKKSTTTPSKYKDAHPYAYYEAATTVALLGEVDSAFSMLEGAFLVGFRDCKLLRTDDRLKSLRQDRRWHAILKKCKAKVDAFLKTVNVKLYCMYQRDEADQKAKALDSNVVKRRNAWRSKKVRKMLKEDKLEVADDYYHAALILYNAIDSSDYKLARKLALKAMELNPKHYDSRALAAMSKDRYLHSIDKPQIYGTQFRILKDKSITREPFDRNAVTERERSKSCISTLCWFLSRIEQHNNKGNDLSNSKVVKP